jgi:cell wall assembly regulator SMI1
MLGMIDGDKLKQTLSRQLDALSNRGYDTRPLIFAPPATASQVEEVERRLGLVLPPSFRTTLLNLSSHVEFRWFAPADLVFPKPFNENFSGDLHWSLDYTLQFNLGKDEGIRTLFPNPLDPYDAVWHNKLLFFDVGNGDYLAIDLDPNRYEQIVYLSHDDGEGHGYVLAENFYQLLVRWVPLACTGGEDWQWLPFTTAKTSFLDPHCTNARAWRALIGIDG